jgi:hypothetical protein
MLKRRVKVEAAKPLEQLVVEKIIYLDQNGWIDLAKIYYGNPTESEKNLLNKIINASEKDTTIFPISMIHLNETCSISKPRWRQQLSSLMASISKCYTLTPYWNRILDIEIQNLVLKTLGLPQINIRKIWLGKGIPHLIGETPSVVSDKKIDPKIIEKLEKDLLEKLEDPKTLEFLLASKFSSKSIERDERNTIKEFEKIRSNLYKIKDNNRRFNYFLAHNITATIAPRLVKTLINFNLPPEFINKIIPHRDIEKFLMSIPTALCEFTLLFQRDQQLQRPIEVNDIADIWHLTLAIPYSDIVVTERMWVSISKQSKLDQKCNTIILSSIKQLNKYL